MMTKREPWPRAFGVIALCVCLLPPARGRAEPADPKQPGSAGSASACSKPSDPKRLAAAVELFNRATAEMDAKNYAGACPVLEDVVQLVPEGHNAMLELGKCYEGQGSLKKAWFAYMRVKDLAVQCGEPQIVEIAAARAVTLWPKLARLTIEVPAEARALPGFTITLDGTPVAEQQWNTARPVDVGPHEVVAKARDCKDFTRRVEFAKDGVEVPLAVTLECIVKPPKRSIVPAIAMGSIAAAGVGVGVITLVLRAGKASTAEMLSGQIRQQRNGQCIPGHNGQDPSCPELHSVSVSGDHYGTASIVGFTVGGAVAIGMVTHLILTARKPSASTLRVAPTFSPAGGGLWVSGGFF